MGTADTLLETFWFLADSNNNEYEFVIRTDVEPWSEYLEKKAAKQAKRDAKGKKKKSVDELM